MDYLNYGKTVSSMKVSILDQNFPAIVIDNFYNKVEEDLIWNELNFLIDGNKLLRPEDTGSAMIEGNIPKKANSGLFLDKIYVDRNISNILTVNRKLVRQWNKIIPSTIDCWWWKAICSEFYNLIDIDTTLVSYYEQDDHYKTHVDQSILTSLTWFYKEPKGFDGGNLILGSTEIEVKSNRMVIFPGLISHEVTPVKMKNNSNKGMGRFCISQFLMADHFNLKQLPAKDLFNIMVKLFLQ